MKYPKNSEEKPVGFLDDGLVAFDRRWRCCGYLGPITLELIDSGVVVDLNGVVLQLMNPFVLELRLKSNTRGCSWRVAFKGWFFFLKK